MPPFLFDASFLTLHKNNTKYDNIQTEEQLAVVMADAPELLSLLDELKACLAEVRSRVGPLLREVSAGGLATAAGLSYLEAKHLLLLQYCMCIVAYLMLKAEGRSVKDHPVIGR
jgi:U3 small nucleolar RNA-associated protein 3